MTNKQKKDLARMLYTQGVLTHQGELAARVGISEVTLSKWKKDGKWEDARKSLLISRPQELRNLYDQLAALNDTIKERTERPYADTKEADILTKLTAAIRTLETDLSLAEVMDVFRKFNEHVEKTDFENVKLLIELQDSYIKTFL